MKPGLCLLLFVAVVLAEPVTYASFLQRLDSQGSYHQAGLLEALERTVPRTLRDEHEMQYEIVKGFVSEYFPRTRHSLGEVKRTFDEFFWRYKQRWVTNMQDTLIKQLELDVSDPAYLKEIRTHPERYSINYETFKILSFKI